MIKIITDYGFCYGVERAIQLLEENGKKGVQVYLTHPLIHNLPENERLMKKAHASFYSEETELSKDSVVVLSAHGHPVEEEVPFQGKVTIADATCPLIQERYRLLKNPSDDVTYVFLGKRKHQETLGFLSHFPFLHLIDSESELLRQLEALSLKKKTFLMPQTTVSEAKRKVVEDYLKERSELILSMPICQLYSRRASQAISFLKDKEADKSYFIVCGDHASSNAKEILKSVLESKKGLQGQIALTLEDLNLTALKGKDIYLASATSAGKDTIEALVTSLEDYCNNP